jgi:cell wall assembly regulator SMI1
MNDLLVRLERWLRQNAPGCHGKLLPGATQTELKGVERALGLRLPRALRELYRWHNGQGERTGCFFFEDAHGCYSFMPLPQVQEMHAGLSEILGELEAEGESGRDTWWHWGWVPFLDAGGDCLCVDAQGTLGGAAGQVISFFHDDSSRVIDYPSLRNWLETFVTSLEAGLWRERDGTLELQNQKRFEQLYQQMNPGYPVVVDSQL